MAVGPSQELAALVGTGTEVVDLEGRTLLPRFIDPHMHSSMMQLADWVDLSPMARPTAEDVFEALRNATVSTTGWVVAQQFDPSITTGHPRLDRTLLDRLVPDRPALVPESNGHIAYVNSPALARGTTAGSVRWAAHRTWRSCRQRSTRIRRCATEGCSSRTSTTPGPSWVCGLVLVTTCSGSVA